MGRLHDFHGRHGSSAPSTSVLHRRAAPKRKPSYRVVFEDVGGKRKKLKTLLHGNSKPPTGYTFIPAGDPQLTSRCKQIAKAEGLTVFIVSTSTDLTKPLSRETHRVGYHFPSSTVDKACDSLGVTLTSTGRVLQSHLANLDERNARPTKMNRALVKKKQKAGNRSDPPPLFDIDSLSQAEIDTQAREALKDLFPNMPGEDLHDIIGRAFQKGKGLVGTAKDVTLVRRAQLAVVAHIRHVYTDYDRLLKRQPWPEARALVEQPTLDKLIQWRGAEDDADEMDEILREVIVIPDDDDEEEDEENLMHENPSSLREKAERDNSVEFIPAENLQTQAIDYAAASRLGDPNRMESPISDDVEVLEYQGQPPSYRSQLVHYDQHRHDQMEAHRRRRWDEARDRRRNEPIYMTDHNNTLLNSGSFGTVPHCPKNLEHQQPRASESGVQMTEAPSFTTSRATVYTQLIPLPKETEPQYKIEPRGVEREFRQSFSNQVIYPIEQHRSSHARRPAESSMNYNANEPHPYSSRPYPSDVQRPIEQPTTETPSFVRPREPSNNPNDVLYPYHSQYLERRHSEVILPSIEGDSFGAREQRNVYHAHPQQVNQLALGSTLNGPMSRRAVPSEYRLDTPEGSPHTKKRKFNERQPLNPHERSWNIDMPLDKRDFHQGMGERHSNTIHDYNAQAASTYHSDVQPFSPDKRIVYFPSRDVISHQGSQRPMSMDPHPGATKSQVVHCVPKEQFQVPVPSVGAPRQPQSLSHSVFVQPVNDYDSPAASSATETIPVSRKILGPSSTLRRSSGMVASDERNLPGAYTVVEYPKRLESPVREIRNPFRHLAIEDRRRTEYKSSMREEQVIKPIQYDRTQSSYTSTKSHQDMYMVDPETGRGQRPRDPDIENSGQYIQSNLEASTRNPFTRYPTQIILRPTRDQWNQQADSRIQPSDMHSENKIPVRNAHSSHSGDTRSQPGGYKNSRPLERRGAAEVIVLE